MSLRSLGLVVSSLALVSAFGGDAAAQRAEGDVLGQCLASAEAALRAEGATPIAPVSRDFLTEGQSRSTPFVLEGDSCVGFLAVGHRRVHDIDLVLMTEEGVVLAQDANVDARPWVRFCGARGLRVVVTAMMYKGQGEVGLLAMANAPPQLPDLSRTVGACFATAGGTRRPSARIGAPPPGPRLRDATETVVAELGALGYTRVSNTQTGEIDEGLREARSLLLEGGRCYAVSVVGDEGVGDIDLFIRTPAGLEVARDDTRRATAVVRLCPDRSGELIADVRMYAGSGAYVLSIHAADLPDAPPPLGIEGNARGRWAEVTRRLSARGLVPHGLAWGMLVPGQTLSIPVDLVAGRCYAFSAVTADEAGEGDLDLMLLDDQGALLGWDVGRDTAPLLFHCAERSGRFAIRGRLYGGWGRYLTIRGEETP
jgi:hypothetical protein